VIHSCFGGRPDFHAAQNIRASLYTMPQLLLEGEDLENPTIYRYIEQLVVVVIHLMGVLSSRFGRLG
jgi:hypothetical protein